MTPPDWKTCDDGIAVLAIHSEGLYRSGDLDMVLDRHRRSDVTAALKEIGFVPGKSRYFKHPECEHLYLEFPPGPVELGEEHPVFPPAEIPVEERILHSLSPTDCVKDRLAAYIYWQVQANFRQAVLVELSKTEFP